MLCRSSETQEEIEMTGEFKGADARVLKIPSNLVFVTFSVSRLFARQFVIREWELGNESSLFNFTHFALTNCNKAWQIG